MKYNITINRIALLVTLGCIQISITGCSQVKNLMDSFSKNNDIEDASPQTVEELRMEKRVNKFKNNHINLRFVDLPMDWFISLSETPPNLKISSSASS